MTPASVGAAIASHSGEIIGFVGLILPLALLAGLHLRRQVLRRRAERVAPPVLP